MKNRQLDATLQSAGLGVASIRDLAASVPITMVPIPAELVGKVGAPYRAGDHPGRHLRGPGRGRADGGRDQLPGDPQRGQRRSRLRHDQGALFDNLDELAAAHAAAKEIKLDQALTGMPVPLHPGAETYYREKGMM